MGNLGLEDFKARGDFPGEMGDDLLTVYLGVDNLGVAAKVVEIGAGGQSSCAVLETGAVKVCVQYYWVIR